MGDTVLNVQHVAVIGAGVSGVSAAVHLKRAGLDVTVYERSSRAGGVWVYDERSARDAAYPSILPSVGDSPEYEIVRLKRQSPQDSPLRETPPPYTADRKGEDSWLSFAPPGPAYVALKNNVSTIEMELSCQSWRPGTEETVSHHVLAEYIQETAAANGVLDSVSFNTRVTRVEKNGPKWKVDISRFQHEDSSGTEETEEFDSVVVAAGHYHACNIPDLPGLKEWKAHFPGRVRHSKLYRRPDEFKGQNVLIVGAGVSSMDIARDLGTHAHAVYQSSRGGAYDLPTHLLPDNSARVGGIESFGSLDSEPVTPDGAIPGTITLTSGQKLCNIHQVILATGYHVSFPFLRQYHADGVQPTNADENVLVTNGQQTHNLHKDIWHIEDPTLALIGVPYHVATFSLFEFQAMALAAVFGGKARLPSREAMRQEYRNRIQRKGAGRTFHSLKDKGDEIEYVQELVGLVNKEGVGAMKGHSPKFLEAYERRDAKRKALFAQVRDPKLDERVIQLMAGC